MRKYLPDLYHNKTNIKNIKAKLKGSILATIYFETQRLQNELQGMLPSV